MSLYCFGKVIPEYDVGKLLEPFQCSIGVPASSDACELDCDDILQGEGSYFSLFDHGGQIEATGLWNSMYSRYIRFGEIARVPPKYALVNNEFEKVDDLPDLLRAVRALLCCEEICGGALAFVDGGIETIVRGTPEVCWNELLKRADKPWDTIDNPVFVWSREG
jgi:hypothetical protein